MKDAPINLLPLPDYVLYADKDMQEYARANVLADRAAASAEPTEKMHLAYEAIDRFLRNNLDDSDYATYSEHLETLWPDPPAAPSPAEPPAAPVQQEPVAFMGRAPGWGWDFEPGDSGPDPTWTECYPLYTHPAPDLRAERDRLEAALADAAVTIGASATLLQRFERAKAERDRLRALLQGILDNHGHVFEHQIAEIRAALSGSKYE